MILCGGESRRFPGGKLLAPVQGEPLLLRVLRRLHGVSSRRLLAGIPPPALALPPGWEVLPDPVPGGGPLAGLVAASRTSPAGFVTAGGDMPRLRGGPLRRLWAARGGADLAAVRGPRGPHPLVLAVGPGLAAELAGLAPEGRLPGPRSLLERPGVRLLGLDELGVAREEAAGFLSDVDTPGDLRQLVAELDP